jgi:hypothetical protein
MARLDVYGSASRGIDGGLTMLHTVTFLYSGQWIEFVGTADDIRACLQAFHPAVYSIA